MRALLSAAFIAGIVAFFGGVLCYDIKNPSVAEASGGGGGGVDLSAYSGSVAITGTSGSTGLTVTGLGGAGTVAISATAGGTNGNAIVATGTGSGTAVKAVTTNGWAVNATSSTGTSVYAQCSSSGNALRGEALSGGYALYLSSDTTSPTRAPIRIDPQDTAPTSCNIGDLSVVVNVLKICTASNTWTTVGVQTP